MSPKRALAALLSRPRVSGGRAGRSFAPPFRYCGLGFVLFLPACSDRTPEPLRETSVVLSGSTMGTYYRVTVASLPETVAEADLRMAVEERLDEINQRMLGIGISKVGQVADVQL